MKKETERKKGKKMKRKKKNQDAGRKIMRQKAVRQERWVGDRDKCENKRKSKETER